MVEDLRPAVERPLSLVNHTVHMHGQQDVASATKQHTPSILLLKTVKYGELALVVHMHTMCMHTHTHTQWATYDESMVAVDWLISAWEVKRIVSEFTSWAVTARGGGCSYRTTIHC